MISFRIDYSSITRYVVTPVCRHTSIYDVEDSHAHLLGDHKEHNVRHIFAHFFDITISSHFVTMLCFVRDLVDMPFPLTRARAALYNMFRMIRHGQSMLQPLAVINSIETIFSMN